MTNKFENTEFLETLENIRQELEPAEKNNRLRQQIHRREALLSFFPDESISGPEKQAEYDCQLQKLDEQKVEIERMLQSLGY